MKFDDEGSNDVIHRVKKENQYTHTHKQAGRQTDKQIHACTLINYQVNLLQNFLPQLN